MVKRGEPFLSPAQHRQRGEEWARQERAFLSVNRHFPYTNERLSSEINDGHNIDFIGEVIPSLIKRVREQERSQRKIKILDLGCGLGFYTDELRTAFPDDAVVYGTTLMRADAALERKELIEAIGRGEHPLAQSHRFDGFSPNMHPNDGKWHTVAELGDVPEFDLMIDTQGELSYAFTAGHLPEAITQASQKLRPNGDLYISFLDHHARAVLADMQPYLQEHYHVTVSLHPNVHTNSQSYVLHRHSVVTLPSQLTLPPALSEPTAP
ncbi:MAG: class I SAM-dependent methyltransferase [Candidatus Kerfeldbacteria bacterium]|nr:class I SAM-dependent methyltransferase [Candidatus Kerfeldbacteria bacterium]